MIASLVTFRRTIAGLRVLMPAFRIPRKALAAICVTTTLGAALEGIGLGLLLPMLELLRSANAPEPMRAVRILMEWFPGRPTSHYVFTLCLLVIASIILKNAMLYLSNRLTAFTRAMAQTNLRDAVFRRLQFSSLEAFEKSAAGEMASVLLLDTGRAAYSIEFLIFLGQRFLIALGYLIALLLISWQLSLMVAALSILCGAVLARLYRILARSGRESSVVSERLSAYLVEVLAGVRLVRSTNSQSHELNRFHHLNAESSRVLRENMDATAALNPITESLGVIGGMGIVAAAAVFLVQPGVMSGDMLLGFAFILLRLLPALTMIYGLYGQTISLAGGVENCEKWLQLPQYPVKPFGGVEFTGIGSSIRVQAVDYFYPNGARALNQVSFDVEPGKITALVGGSGSGKSTMASILLRLRAPSSGCILVDGVDYWDFTPESWHRNVAIVDQEAFLFRDSLANNISYGKRDVSPEELQRSLRMAHLEEVVEALPRKLDTVVGERGASLSGGQRQRMSIARAVVRNPKLLILDEATSALDSVSEAQVQAAIEEVQQDRTVLIIAHRFSTIRRAHKIVVMDQGRVVEQGSWDELERRQGAFHRLLSASMKVPV